MTILVTGGAGYIGSHTVRHLVAAGHNVRVIDNFVYGHHEALIDDSVILIKGDLRDADVLEQAFSVPIDTVVHFAAYAYVGESVTDPLKYYSNNLASPLSLLKKMETVGCKQFVFSSTCATYGIPEAVPIIETTLQKPINPYGASKMMLERVLEDCNSAWGLNAIFLRYFNASGCSSDSKIGEDHTPETHLIPRVLMAAVGEIEKIDVYGTDYPTPDGTCIRDYIHVEDLASAHVKAVSYLNEGGETTAVNLGTGRGLSVREILDSATKITGKAIPVSYGPRREGDPPQLISDPSKARNLLGWVAENSDVDNIIQTAWNWITQPHGGRYENY